MLRNYLLTLAPAIALLAASAPIAPAQTSQNTPAGDVFVNGALCLSDDNACVPGAVIPDNLELQLRDSVPGIYFDQTVNPNDFAILIFSNQLVVRDRGVDGSVLTDMVVIEAGAPDNSLRIDSSGAIGFGTATPGKELHVTGSAT